MAQVIEFDGSNALRSVVSPHTGPDASGRYPFVEYLDLETDSAFRIAKRRGRQLVGTVPGTITAIHEFERVNPTNGDVTRHIFVATTSGIYEYAGGSTFNAMTLPYVPAASAWSFTNFANRCFAVNGADQAIVFDGTSWRI